MVIDREVLEDSVRRIRCYFIFLALFAIGETFLQSPVMARNYGAAENQRWADFVQNVAEQALEIINRPGARREDIIAGLRALLLQNFAIHDMAAFVLGRFRRKLTQVQQDVFLDYFVDLLVALYALNFDAYKNAVLRVINVQQKTGQLIQVMTKIEIPGKPTVLVTWLLSLKGGSRIYDAAVDVVSFLQLLKAQIQGMQKGEADTFMKEIEARKKKLSHEHSTKNS
jgi:phospholipid transport system substrate-binding protein